MIKVRFYPAERPFFIFDSGYVPAEHYIIYSLDSEMGEYLDRMLQPSQISTIHVCSDKKAYSVSIEYELDEITVLHMPAFTPVEEGHDDNIEENPDDLNNGDDCAF